MEGVLSRTAAERLAVVALGVLAATLLLARLGDQYLWQDEAQTAVIARTILSHGVPLGHDGRNSFSHDLGREFGDDRLWKWHTWLSFYAVAASFAVLGESTAAARLPFVLCGIATVLVSYRAGRVFWQDRRAALAGALLLALCIPFLVLSRQCRYYAMAALLSLLGLVAYARLDGNRRAGWSLFASATLLFHTQYIYCATLLASLLVHALVVERARLATTARWAAAVALVNLPWILWFADIRPGGDTYLPSVRDLGKATSFATGYVSLLADQLFPVWLLLALPVIAITRLRRDLPLPGGSAQTRSCAALVAIYCAVSIVLLSVLSPLAFFRYLAPLLPPLLLLAGLVIAALWRVHPAIATLVVVVWVATGDLRNYVHEITHDFIGPIEGIVAFLRENGSDDDTLAINYGDMPLKFYTGMRILGGLTGEDLAPARRADWIIPRFRANSRVDARVKQELLSILADGGYRLHTLDVPDTRFENREGPRHRFRSAGDNFPRVQVYQRLP
jgi:hypothetical protein